MPPNVKNRICLIISKERAHPYPKTAISLLVLVISSLLVLLDGRFLLNKSDRFNRPSTVAQENQDLVPFADFLHL